MGWRIVRQPNGLLARFSDVVDNFTCYDMTVEEALLECQNRLGVEESKTKVQAGIEDHEPWKHMVKGHGLSRWDDCLESIVMQHGHKELKELLVDMKLSKYLPDASIFESNADNR
jgi:hypothetical protein